MEAWALPAHYKVWKKIQPKLFLISRLTLPPDWPSLCLENLGNVGVIKITVVNTFVSIFLTHMDDKFHYFDRNSDKISISPPLKSTSYANVWGPWSKKGRQNTFALSLSKQFEQKDLILASVHSRLTQTDKN